ncbi:MAG: Fe3+-hydroxamate ABC transporter substrate-binding protein [Methanomicrobiales archaeon HGW-Methanomicrobiales-2]|jgi:iron complex transport system substrate-binding protein|nr:MAG: Fe3+-hydroxamate ABC transporter substrate-binding protein [Methanomicrobiales archaeon HGW-Methanomicrobiales-2]
MTRTSYVLCALIIAAGMLCCGCTTTTGTPDDPAAPAGTRTITDMEGHQIVLPASGATFGIFGGPISQVPYLLGANESITAVTKGPQMMEMMQQMDPGIASKPAPRTTNGNVNIEQLLVTNPDCVIAFDVDGEIVESQTDIPVIYLSGTMSDGFEEIRQEIVFMGEVFQRPERAQAYIDYLDETLAFLENRTADIPDDERVTVFLGEGVSHLQTLGGDTFFTEWTEAAGCRNAVAAIETTQGQQEGMHTGINEVSMEQVLAVDPGLIIIDASNPADLAKDNRWKELTAVKEGRIYKQPTGLFLWSRPSAESAVLYPVWIAYMAYPDRFADVPLTDRVKDFYTEVFEFPITDAQAQKVIDGAYGSVTFGQVQQSR